MLGRLFESLTKAMAHLADETAAMRAFLLVRRREHFLHSLPSRFASEDKKELLKCDLDDSVLFSEEKLRELDDRAAARSKQVAIDRVALGGSGSQKQFAPAKARTSTFFAPAKRKTGSSSAAPVATQSRPPPPPPRQQAAAPGGGGRGKGKGFKVRAASSVATSKSRGRGFRK